jgi:RNA polymerase sigma-70 factor (subfamily 1)
VAGDQFALGELLLSCSHRLSAYLAPKVPASLQRTITVDDILQQTYISAFRRIDQFEPRTPQALLAWLKKIADHRLLDELKAQTRKKRGGQQRSAIGPTDAQCSSMMDLVDMLSDGGRTASQVIARQEAIHAIQIGIAGLPADQQLAVRLHLIEGKSLAETAEAMDRTAGSVSALIYRAKENLREVMGRASTWLSGK